MRKYALPSVVLLIMFLTGATCQVFSQDTTKTTVSVKHGNKGFEFQTSDNNYLLQIQSRLQFRFATPGDQNPVNFDDFNEEKRRIFKINRARFKVGGHAFRPWIKYYWEYELAQGNLLDFKVMIEKFPWLSFKAGQWKTDYNRERVISSGQQQMVERSIINRPFTLDRQQGVCVYGHLDGKGIADFNYWVSVLTGNGRGASTSDDKHLMYVTRVQWNFTGIAVAMEGSDTEYHEKAAGSIALAGVTNRSPYTRFSQAGGGELEGFEDGAAGQYRVNQWVVETAYMYRGFSWQNEIHQKEINDLINGNTTTLFGSYWQAGYFFHYLWTAIPKPLEVAFRYANYRPDVSIPKNTQQEYALAFNWFFKDHLNKLTAEITWFEFQDVDYQAVDGARFRVQWDISL